MKMLIFVIFLALLACAVFWRVRTADAKRDLAKRRASKYRQLRRQRAIKPQHHGKWPVIIRQTGRPESELDEKRPEPSMTTIEFKPGSRASASH
jgi:hypothetical protein